jgi:Uma2 family endonuclease
MSLPAASIAQDRDDSPREDHFVGLDGLSWADYERLDAARGEHSSPRLTFDRGYLQIMSPGRDHERVKSYLGCLLEVWAEESGADLTPLGSWALKDHVLEKGAEPDECYVLGEGPRELPDLAIDVIWTSGSMDKLGIYAALGVPEVWIWRGGSLRVFVTAATGGYEEVGASRLFPALDLQVLLQHLEYPTVTQAQRAYRRRLQSV